MMKSLSKRIIALFSMVLLLISSFATNVYAYTASGSTQPSQGVGKADDGTFEAIWDMGFRVFLYDTAKDGNLWEGSDGSYKSLSGVAENLDKNANKSAVYLRRRDPDDPSAYDRSVGGWVDINQITDDEFNTFPGMSDYTSPAVFSGIKLDDYADIFNKINTKANTTEGMSEIIEWFKNHDAVVDDYSPETSLVVVEVVEYWRYGSSSFIETYQLTREFSNTRNGSFSAWRYAFSLADGCDVDSDVYTPNSSKSAQAYYLALMGGLYQSSIAADNDCKTVAYDSSSGYAYYGAEKVMNNNKVAENIAIVYDGATNTSNSDNFKVYSGLNQIDSKAEINPSTSSYDGKYYTGSGFESISSIENSLGISNVNQLNDYDMALYDTYKVNMGSAVDFDKLLANVDASKLNVKWGKIPATGGSFNVGSAYSVTGVSYANGVVKSDTTPIMDSVISKLNNSSTYNHLTSGKKLDIAGTSSQIANYLLGYVLKNGSTEGLASNVSKNQQVGVSIEFFVKGEAVSSNIVTITKDLDAKETTSSKDTKNYSTAGFGNFVTSSDAVYMIVVPNNDAKAYSDATVNELKALISNTNASGVVNAFKNYFDSSSKALNTSVQGGDSVTVGAVTSSNKNYGYTVYVLAIKGDVPLDGSVELKDYELNYVFPNIVANSTGSSAYINKNLFTINQSKKNEVSCVEGIIGYTYPTKDYSIKVTDISSGTVVSADNGASSTKYLLYNSMNGSFGIRDTVKSGLAVNTLASERFAPTYAMNLTRAMFGDIRTMSSISNQEIDKSFATDVLGLNYGNTPNGVVNASNVADSNATVGYALTDIIKFKAEYSLTGNTNRLVTVSKIHSCEGGTKTYQDVESVNNALKAFNVSGINANIFTLNLTEVAHKYTANNIEVATSGVADGLIKFRNSESSKSDSKLLTNYSASFVKENAEIIKYYAEVPMRAYHYSGNAITSNADVTATTVLTMSEKLRQSKASSLYIINVSNGSGNNAVTGKTDSLSATGTSKTPVVYRGGDVTMSIKDTDLALNLFGYSVDVVNKSVDETMKLTDSSSVGYQSIVADNSDIYSIWGNSDNTAKLFEEYKDFVSSVTNLDNLGVDMELKLSNNKEYNNFEVSVGGVSSYSSSETYTYPITIKNGAIDTQGEGYKALISQLANDYGVSSAEAKELFRNSGLYTGVINAIEDCKDAFNKSQAGGNLGGNGHWYDETVKTIVIRRYATTPITLKNIILQDKIDYDANTSQSTSSGVVNKNTGKNVDAEWYMTVYFKKLPDFFSAGAIYSPARNNKADALKSGTVLVNSLYVNGADFEVSYKTTEDMD